MFSKKISRPLYKLFLTFIFGVALLISGCDVSNDQPIKATSTQNSVIIPVTNATPIKHMDAFIDAEKVDKTAPDWKTKLQRPPLLTFNTNENYYWDINTNKGKISILFKPEVAPMHVSNAIYLTRLGFYNNTIFHRVIPGFMAQGGDPLGTGQGNPGYAINGEFNLAASHDKVGVLSTANAGPSTDGSQFFITFKAQKRLDGSYTVFGQVVDGLDTLKRLESFGSIPSGKTSEKLEIISAAIRVEPKRR